MTTNPKQILWVDDEIELLSSHIKYLSERGYEVAGAANGPDALEMLHTHSYDIVLLDEMMPVMDGLEVLKRIKSLQPALPVVMVTKNEAEELMEQAIGSQIAGFLTKPVNPSQILSVLKGILEQRKITAARFPRDWAEGFADISRQLDEDLSAEEWMNLHVQLCNWELRLDEHSNPDLANMLREVRLEADRKFAKWIEDSYPQWIKSEYGKRPILSTDLVNHHLIPVFSEKRPTLFLVIDCLRMDQYLSLEVLLKQHFDVKRSTYFSILPTATPYSRNSLFSGLLPVELELLHSDLWAKGDEDEGSSNRFERQFLNDLLKRRGLDLKPEPRYVKALEVEEVAEFERKVKEFTNMPLTSLVYNFVDILVHTRQSVEVLKEMLPDESAFRSVTRAWFQHSSLLRILIAYAEAGGVVVLTSDHGAVRGRRGSKVIGDRQTSTSLRYKHGRNLQCDLRHTVKIKDPALWGLPKRGINSEYLIAREDYFFVYPTNYHKYLELYRDSFQHGGISLDEMVLPVVTLRAKYR